jgi:hypothetical protein
MKQEVENNKGEMEIEDFLSGRTSKVMPLAFVQGKDRGCYPIFLESQLKQWLNRLKELLV